MRSNTKCARDARRVPHATCLRAIKHSSSNHQAIIKQSPCLRAARATCHRATRPQAPSHDGVRVPPDPCEGACVTPPFVAAAAPSGAPLPCDAHDRLTSYGPPAP
eukprot:3148933-Prymnesium_polylepis.2